MNWTNCTENLPENLVDVLVMRKNGRMAVMYREDRGYTVPGGGSGTESIWAIDGDARKDEDVTHWMPLPDEPDQRLKDSLAEVAAAKFGR